MASQDGLEGSTVARNGNSADPSSQRGTPISEATPASQAASPTSQATSSSAGSKRRRTLAIWDEMQEKFEKGQRKAECNYCHKTFAAGPRAGTTHLRLHLESCTARHAPMGPKQQKLRLTKGEGSKVTIENVIF
uniref:Uncharacterized protein n=1 Tax=Avena sativa TaxID=4498 RepID=A0ACD5UI83_AVESA